MESLTKFLLGLELVSPEKIILTLNIALSLFQLLIRREADKVLAEKALGRVFAKDAKFGERLAALDVAEAIKLKR